MNWKHKKVHGRYLLFSDFGNVIDIETNRHLRLVDVNGYWHFVCDWGIRPKRCKLHVEIATLFIGPSPGKSYSVNHINHCKRDNRASNLEWVTPSDNLACYVKFKTENPLLEKLIRDEDTKRRSVKRFDYLTEEIPSRHVYDLKCKYIANYPPPKFNKKAHGTLNAYTHFDILLIGINALDSAEKQLP